MRGGGGGFEPLAKGDFFLRRAALGRKGGMGDRRSISYMREEAGQCLRSN